MKNSSINKHVLRWIEMVESGDVAACEDQRRLVSWVRKCFETENIYTDDEQLADYLGLSKYFPFDVLFEWEHFCIALHLCTYWRETGQPRWPDLFLLIGRGAGKDGYIALEGMCLISPYSKLSEYDVDICANAEEQAMRPVNDVLAVLDNVRHTQRMRKHFHWTKEKITGLQYRGVMRGRTNNPGSKDGMRSGIVIFNEIHQYQNYANIKVFVTGLGKKKHPRRLYATTNGDVRDGPLDELLARSEQILKGDIGDNGLLPFICRLDNKNEANDPTQWAKANPSLPHLPDLMSTIQKEYEDWKVNPAANADFMTKRMNLPQSDAEIVVTSWENIMAACRPLPDLTGCPCIAGVDYAKTSDFVAAGLWFKVDRQRYWLTHSWMCANSPDLPRIKYPVRQAAADGLLTIVDDVEVSPDIVVNWLVKQAATYNIQKVVLDNFRFTLFSSYLRKAGYLPLKEDGGTVKLIRPSDQMKVVPLVESLFSNQKIAWGENNHLMRWYTNNTKLTRSEADKERGNYTYGKIEPRSRKTDGFMAMIAAACLDDALADASTPSAMPSFFTC